MFDILEPLGREKKKPAVKKAPPKEAPKPKPTPPPPKPVADPPKPKPKPKPQKKADPYYEKEIENIPVRQINSDHSFFNFFVCIFPLRMCG